MAEIVVLGAGLGGTVMAYELVGQRAVGSISPRSVLRSVS